MKRAFEQKCKLFRYNQAVFCCAVLRPVYILLYFCCQNRRIIFDNRLLYRSSCIQRMCTARYIRYLFAVCMFLCLSVFFVRLLNIRVFCQNGGEHNQTINSRFVTQFSHWKCSRYILVIRSCIKGKGSISYRDVVILHKLPQIWPSGWPCARYKSLYCIILYWNGDVLITKTS